MTSPSSPNTSSPSSTSTTFVGEFSDELEVVSRPARSRSLTNELTLDIAPGRLSPQSKATYDSIWMEIANGHKPSELASSLGVAPSWVSDRLAELKLEILFSQGVFPPLSDEQYDALRTSIDEQGVLVPIVVDEDGAVIDGRHRKKIAAELGRECPIEVAHGLTLSEKRELAITLNASRRHLTTRDKQTLVVAELMQDRDRSNRAIARVVGVDDKTVGRIRKGIEIAEGIWENPPEPTLEDDGVLDELDTLPERVFGVAQCPCCDTRLRALKVRGEFLLEAF